MVWKQGVILCKGVSPLLLGKLQDSYTYAFFGLPMVPIPLVVSLDKAVVVIWGFRIRKLLLRLCNTSERLLYRHSQWAIMYIYTHTLTHHDMGFYMCANQCKHCQWIIKGPCSTNLLHPHNFRSWPCLLIQVHHTHHAYHVHKNKQTNTIISIKHNNNMWYHLTVMYIHRTINLLLRWQIPYTYNLKIHGENSQQNQNEACVKVQILIQSCVTVSFYIYTQEKTNQKIILHVNKIFIIAYLILRCEAGISSDLMAVFQLVGTTVICSRNVLDAVAA